jgi:hypothetical protein
MDELHAQIFDLEAIKAGGSLLGHLKEKMKEISTEVQKNTFAIVAEQEKATLAKVQLAEALSDLTIGKKAMSASR